MGEWVSKVNQGFHRAADEMCSGAEVKDFDPQVNSLPIWDDRINRGTFDPWTRIYQNPRGHLDSLWKEEVAVDCDDPDCFSPSWDRSLYRWTFRAGMCDSTTVDSLKSFIEANLRGVDGSVRQVVGHTKADQPVRTDPEGLLFGIDSSMSRGLCSRDSPCVYSVLVMKNFGSPEWESDPIIYRKTMQLRSWMGFEGSVLQCDKFGDHDMDGMILSDPNPHAWSTVTCASIGESVDGAADQAPEPADPPTKRITETRPSTPAEEVPVKATGATFVMLDPTGSTAAETDSELMKELKRRKARAARRRELEGSGGDGVEDPPVPKLRMRPPSLDILSLNADNLPAPETKMKPPSLDVLSLNNADESVGAAPSTPRSESPPPRKLKKLRKPARGRDIDRVLEELMNPSDTQNGA